MLLCIIALASMIVLCVFYYIYWFKYVYWKKRRVLGPRPTFLLGNIGKSIVKKRPLAQVYLDVYKNYSNLPYVGLYQMLSPILLLRHIDIINNVLLRDRNIFLDPMEQSRISTATSEKETIRNMKINSKQIKAMFPLLKLVGEELMNYIRLELEINTKAVFSAKGLSDKFMAQSIGICTFEENGIHLRDAGFMESSMCPEVDSVFKKHFTDAMLCENDDSTIRDYFRFAVCRLKQEGKLNKLSDEDVVTYVNRFSSDEYEVGSTLMMHSLYELATHPETQDQLKDEIYSFLFERNDFLTYKSIQKMDYLDCIVKEVLRLHPPAEFLERVCNKTYTLSLNEDQSEWNLAINTGTIVIIPIHGIFLNPKHFPEPGCFNPKRFSGRCTNASRDNLLLSFSINPNVQAAISYVKIGVTYMVSNFRIEIDQEAYESTAKISDTFSNMRNSSWLKLYPRTTYR